LVRANQIDHQDIMKNTDRQSVSDLDGMEVPLPADDDPRIWGSDLIAQAIRTLDLEYVALNPGASFRGLHDSLVNHNANTAPKMLLCLHEESAVAIAHGYAKVRNRPMGVILHSNVGLMHGTMGIFNAWCDRVPMVVLGATALCSVPAAIEALLRANQIAQTAPRGPVYVNLDASLQEQLLPAPVSVPSIARYQPPAPVAPNPAALDEALRLVAGARAIVMLVGRVSRDEGDWLNRIALAERLGASVITDLKLGAAFPTAHSQHLGPPGFFLAPDALAALSHADLILSLDWVDLAGAFKQAFGDAPPAAKVIHASLDQQLHRGWGTEYFGLPAADVYAMCDADTFAGALAARLDAPPAMNARPARAPAAPAGQVSIKAIADALNTQAGAQPVCLARLPLGWNGSYRDFHHPLDYLGYDGGGGIGSGPGMCVGAALALRGDQRTVVGILGDGDFLMGVTALWSACHYQIPLLLIVANNRSFFNDEMHQERVALERGRPTGNRWIGQRMSEPDIDLAAMARAQGAVGLGPIADMEQLERAIGEGLAAVRSGQVCVIDVRVVPGYDANLSGQAERGTSTRAAR
jgi:thiamine pyrophosphate-dependent acetolactate synthase large subunit-like protein